jgi:hypothetical protein
MSLFSIHMMYQHFKCCHAVDDSNGRRHAPISIETSWGTKHWEDHVFAFFIAITEVNIVYAKAYFTGADAEPWLEARQKLALEMLNNKLVDNVDDEKDSNDDGEGQSKQKRQCSHHEQHNLITIPPYRGRRDRKKRTWKKSKMEHLQQCCLCRKWVRKYCSCDRSVYYCLDCYFIIKMKSFPSIELLTEVSFFFYRFFNLIKSVVLEPVTRFLFSFLL